MNILITGAAGFIGSHLATRLLREGNVVFGVDNFITGSIQNIEHLKKEANFHFIEKDASLPLEIKDSLDWVMHFASPASPPKYLKFPIETLRINSEGTYHLLQLSKNKNSKFFLASTSECYGDPLVHPQPESYWGNVNPIGVRSVYDEAKRYAEAITCAFHRHYNLPIRIIRIFNTYGPCMDIHDGRVVTNFIYQALNKLPFTIYGDGSQTRSFQYIDDLVNGIRKLMEVDYYNPVNLGNPKEFNMLQLAEIIKELTESNIPFIYEPLPSDDPKQRKPDIALAKKLLGWEPRIELRNGLLETIHYFKSTLT